MIINEKLLGLTLKNNFELILFINLIIYILILVALPLVVMGFLALIKPEKIKSNEKSLIYLYAFSTGMFLMLGAFGFLREGYEMAHNFTHSKYFNQTEMIRTITVMGIMGISSLIGFSIVIGGRYLFVKKSKIDPHSKHEEHNHSDHLISFRDIDNPKAAWLAILMLLSHRIIDGFFIGYTIFKIVAKGNSFSSATLLLVTFTLHILFEIVIVYFRQIQYGEKIGKAVLYNFLTFLAIVPFIFLGAYTGTFLGKRFEWILSGILVMGGVIVIFTSIFELVPEFIHIRNKDTKVLYKTLITFAAAIILTIMLLALHRHT
ncbi:ZIP family metal transporter [Mycoplasma enhydrae]|uniref:ZIP family metal transporter n=1 Tax=Mycoplasma enhydrae TaxID=2499220 RepID=UPI0021E90F9F|nr:ZIP family metal transporter [Mycoplasma enhydrae]MCV3733621.1 ZIP family metal transporter [Mycoplasma enhydrae]